MLKHCLHPEEQEDISMAFFESIEQVPRSWDELASQQPIYLSTDYLKSIEKIMKGQMSFRYIMFFKDSVAVAIASFQIIKVDTNAFETECFIKKERLFGKVLDQVNIRCLINGTLFGSGEYGFAYSQTLADEEAFKVLAKGVKKLCVLEEAREKIHIIMVKDYFPERKKASDHLVEYKYRGFKMEPNMVLELKEEWNVMDDYLASMSAKYRKGAKTAYKKSKEVEGRELSLPEIVEYQEGLKSLFTEVQSKAKRKLGTLDLQTFVELKRNLSDRFIVKGYFLGNEMVGFSSAFVMEDKLDANYVGLNYEYNRSHSIYLRMLYDLVDLALKHKVKKLHFGRTAGEIKSNTGAKSVDMECYVRTKNSVSNKIIKPFVKRVSTPDFVERNPFK